MHTPGGVYSLCCSFHIVYTLVSGVPGHFAATLVADCILQGSSASILASYSFKIPCPVLAQKTCSSFTLPTHAVKTR